MFEYISPKNSLKHKNIIVTGAGSGIGKTAALTYAAYGATVILLGRHLDNLIEVRNDIVQQNNPTPIVYSIDFEIATERDYYDFAETLSKQVDCVDGLLHNASQLGVMTTIDNYPYDIWMTVMQVNLNSTFLLTRALLPLLRRANNGSIVFTTSGKGHQGSANWGAYSVSKFATEGLMQIIADEEEQRQTGIRCNCLNPGGTRTAMRADAFPQENPSILPTPQDIMPLYLYLMGSDSLSITGQVLHVRTTRLEAI